ncbi:hypothetical protein [Marimonas lutisalis]|uniref:hypothetical protein n=1 Tax=Marimonas lutisalis TaxID=2545756 RepID=UPI0010F8D2E2|nr:hypothetical protein [Marimonas lutisalis]
MFRSLNILSFSFLAFIAHAEDVCVPSLEVLCMRSTDAALYYFDAIEHGGVPGELLAVWLIKAESRYDPTRNNAERNLISRLGKEIERGERTKFEAIDELFMSCMERLRSQ